MSFPSGDYYYRLRLPRNASRREIKAAFRRLARQYHPDLCPHHPGAIARFQALQEAYEVLIDRVQRQRYDRAQQVHSSSIPLDPQTPADFYIRGVSYSLACRYRAALRDYTRAIALDDQFAEAYLRRAEVRYQLEDDSGVLADCQRAIALDATEAKTYYYQGMARYRLNYVQSSITAFTQAIACDLKDARYYYRRGLAHQDLYDLNEAARDLRRAARLYREQGDLTKYQRLQQYLKPFGTAGRSRPIQALGKAAERVSQLTGRRSVRHRPTDPIRPLAILPPPAAWPLSQLDELQAKRQPPPSVPPPPKPQPRLSRQTYWAPGISSRPPLGHRPSKRLSLRLLLSVGAVLKLLSNPAGEIVPTYWQLSAWRVTLAGYSLAVMANLCWVAAGLAYLSADSWLVASRLWAAGGLMFVAMVLTMAIARTCLRIRGLWAADIFILGTAIAPLGILAAATLMIRQSATWTGWALESWPVYTLTFTVTLWAFSHALIALHSGLARIHAFPERTAAWLAPAVLATGIAAGAGTWQLLTSRL